MHLAPFRHGVLEQSSMSIWHTAPLNPERHTEKQLEVTGRSSPRQLHCQQTLKPTQSSANLHQWQHWAHTPRPGWICSSSNPLPQRFCLPGQRSLSLKTEMAKSNRNKADGAQVVSTTGQLCLPVKLRACQQKSSRQSKQVAKNKIPVHTSLEPSD